MSESNTSKEKDYLCYVERDEVRFKLKHRKLGRVENFVAKLSISFYTENLEVDITTCVPA